MSARGDRRLFACLFGNFLLYGGVSTIVGATLPSVIRDLGWSYLAAGSVIAASASGYFVTTFLSGFLVTWIGPRKLIVAGLLLQAVGIGTFGLVPQIVWNIAALVLLGIGQGTTEVVTNYSVVRMERHGQSRLMNLMHSAFTVGAIVAPFAAGMVMALWNRWRPMYLALAALSALMTFVLARPSLPYPTASSAATLSLGAFGRLSRQPLLLLLTLTILLYVGAEMGISAWLSEYFVKTFEVNESVGASMVSVFWLGILLGRLGASAGYRGTRQADALVAFAAVAALAQLGALTVHRAWFAGGMFFVAGLGFSAIYPIVMAIAGNSFREHQGVVIGVVSTGGGVGACLFPLVMSGMAEAFGIRTGFWFYWALTCLMVVVALAIFRRTNRPGSPRSEKP